MNKMDKIKNFQEFTLNESEKFCSVKSGQKVNVQFNYLQGTPVSEVEAKSDSTFNEHFQTESFSFLFGGDMMMFAKWDGQKWISE